MKKFNYTFAVFSIVTAIIFILTGAFLSGTVSTPSSFWLTTVKKSGEDIKEASATFLLDRTVKKEKDGEEVEEVVDIGGAYVFIGEIYSSDKDGKATIYFDFKTEYSSDDKYVERKTLVADASTRYGWAKVFSDENVSSCSKVKIHTPYELEIGEVVFLFTDGNRIPVERITEQTAYGENPTKDAKLAIDEKNSFDPSSSVKNVLTEFEKEEMSVAYGLFTGGKKVGNSPLATILNGISVMVFGRNTFALRFFSLVAGYGCVILAYRLFYRLFGKDEIALIGGTTVLALGAVFGGASLSSANLPTFFILSAYYLAVGFFADEYEYKNGRSAVLNLVLTGVFAGLSVACGAKYILALLAVPVLWGISLGRLSAKFKVEYENSTGLKKDDIYIAYTKKKSVFGKLMPVCFILIPAFVAVLSYAIVGNQLKNQYGDGFLLSMLKDVGNSFVPSFSAEGTAYFFGATGDVVSSVPRYISVFAILFLSLGFFFGDAKFKGAVRAFRNKFTIISVFFICLLVSFILGYGDGKNSFGSLSVICSAYLLLLVCVIEKLAGKKADKAVYISIISALTLLFVFCNESLVLLFGA